LTAPDSAGQMPFMSRNASRSAARRASRRPGLGAGAWQRRRRVRTVPPHDAIDSQDGTWMTLSLDGESTDDAPANLAPAPVSRTAPPQSPPLVESASDHPAVVTDIGPSAFLPVGTDPPTPREEARSLSPATSLSSPSVSASVSDSSASISISDEDSVVTGEVAVVEVVERGPLLEEDTEAVEVPLPDVQRLTLADELLPWPQLLVQPTLVLPGAWPPPLDAVQRSAPSVVALMEEPSEPLSDISLELDPDESLPALTEEPSVKSFDGVDSLEVAALVREVLAEPDTGPSTDLFEPTEDVSVDTDADGASLSLDAPLTADRTDEGQEEPAAEGTDEAEVSLVDAIDPDDEPGGHETDEAAVSLALDGDDDSPTEVSDRDALEDALAVLRTAEPGTVLGPPPEDEPEDEEAVTAEDLVSLEMVAEAEHPVNPAVRTDMELTPVPLVSQPRREVAWMALGGPTIRPSSGPARAWIELGGPAVPTAARLGPHVPLGPGEASVADEAGSPDEDWLADLGPTGPH